MSHDLYDWDADLASGLKASAEVARSPWRDPAGRTFNEWDPTGSARRAEVAARMAATPLDQVNMVTGHALDCACPKCPCGQTRARQEREDVTPEKRPNPLMDQVVPVSILMAVFTICAMVLLPVVMPFVVVGSMSIALLAVCIVVVVACGLTAFGVISKAARANSGGPRVIRGRVVQEGSE